MEKVMETKAKTFGEYVRSERKKSTLSTKEFANELGIHINTETKIEKNQRQNIYIDYLFLLDEKFGIDLFSTLAYFSQPGIYPSVNILGIFTLSSIIIYDNKKISKERFLEYLQINGFPFNVPKWDEKTTYGEEIKKYRNKYHLSIKESSKIGISTGKIFNLENNPSIKKDIETVLKISNFYNIDILYQLYLLSPKKELSYINIESLLSLTPKMFCGDENISKAQIIKAAIYATKQM